MKIHRVSGYGDNAMVIIHIEKNGAKTSFTRHLKRINGNWFGTPCIDHPKSGVFIAFDYKD